MTTETLNLQYDFTDEELDDMTENLVSLIKDRSDKEIEKKELVKDYNRDLKDLNKRISRIAKLVRDKHTFRDIACTVEFHKPETGHKRIVRSDTGEAWEEEMTAADWTLFNQANDDDGGAPPKESFSWGFDEEE